MLVSVKSNITAAAPRPSKLKQPPVSFAHADQSAAFISKPDLTLTKAIGQLQPGINTHYYSYGNFNLVRLVVYLLKQLGPSHVFLVSYSFSNKSITALDNLIKSNQILSFKVLLDNRVRSISPKPFQQIASLFNYRCTSVHAKCALISNEDWSISVVTSQNATDNPKLERGVIYTDPNIFQFDKKILNDAFNAGTT